jgi:hypothetical protein
LTSLAHRNPPGVNFIHAACDLLLLGLSMHFQRNYPSSSFCIVLTSLAHRNPPGVNFIHAACDLLLLGLSILFSKKLLFK